MCTLPYVLLVTVTFNLLIVILVPAVQNRAHAGCQESREIHWPADEAHGVKRSNSCKIDKFWLWLCSTTAVKFPDDDGSMPKPVWEHNCWKASRVWITWFVVYFHQKGSFWSCAQFAFNYNWHKINKSYISSFLVDDTLCWSVLFSFCFNCIKIKY